MSSLFLTHFYRRASGGHGPLLYPGSTTAQECEPVVPILISIGGGSKEAHSLISYRFLEILVKD